MTTLTLFIEVLLNIYQLALINFSFNYCHHRTFTTTIITNISITCPTINTPTLRIMIHQNTTTAPQPPTTMPPPHYHTTTITYSITTKSPALTSSTVTSIFSSIVTASINTFCNTWVASDITHFSTHCGCTLERLCYEVVPLILSHVIIVWVFYKSSLHHHLLNQHYCATYTIYNQL